MNSRAPQKWLRRPMPGLIAMPEEIVVPVDVFLHMSSFMTFTNYQNFIRAFWPDGEEDGYIEKKLWKMSCHKFEATFYNGKRLEIEYNFDVTRKERRRVLIKAECLLPIFGEVSLSGLDEFVSILELENFIEDNVTLERCSSYRYICYPCHLMRRYRESVHAPFAAPTPIECKEGHFHYYCKEHVISWLGNYLYTLILLRESKQLFDQEIEDQYAYFPSSIPYFQSGSRATPQYLLESALHIDISYFHEE